MYSSWHTNLMIWKPRDYDCYIGLFVRHVYPKVLCARENDCGDSKSDFLPGTCFFSPSRSPAAPPARTTVFSSCYRTPDFPQKCSRQNRANNNWVNCPTVSLVRTFTRSLNHLYSSYTNLSKKYNSILKKFTKALVEKLFMLASIYSLKLYLTSGEKINIKWNIK